ncbi:hypothetical protein FBULB1_11929 [Fusarium bulbicola]|nr:hypothetical protein FBULB1_11929 [Fusarium bulbicola]
MSGRIKPWQRKALEVGRTPLPEAPGLRPWLRNYTDLDTSSPDEFSEGSSSGSPSGHEVRGSNPQEEPQPPSQL